MQVVIWADPQEKEENTEKQKVYRAIFSLITLFKCWLVPFEALQAKNFFVSFHPNYSRLSWLAGNVRDFRDLCY